MPKKLKSTIPKATIDATSAAIAKAVPPLSLSTTVRATATPAARGATTGTPLGAAVWDAPGLGTTPPAPATGVMGLATCVAAGDGPPAGFGGTAPPAGPGRGGREILIVSFRKSAGGLARPGTAGGVTPGGLGAAPGNPGTAGGVGTPAPGALGIGGLGPAGGDSRIVSFFRPGAGATGEGAAGGPGGLGKDGVGALRPTPGGAKGGLGRLGIVGAGTLGAPGKETPGGRGGEGGLGTGSDIA